MPSPWGMSRGHQCGGAMAALAMERAILRAVQSAGSAYGLIGWEDLPR